MTRSVDDWVTNRPVGRIVVGGQIARLDSDSSGSIHVTGGLEGCVKVGVGGISH